MEAPAISRGRKPQHVLVVSFLLSAVLGTFNTALFDPPLCICFLGFFDSLMIYLLPSS